MKIAIPVAGGILCAHFGHCQQFAIVEVDEKNKEIKGVQTLNPPAHEPGVLPQWLGEMGVDMIIAGGMGGRAIQLFNQRNVRVHIGAPAGKPEDIVNDYLHNRLPLGENLCDH
jgi:ATP-binding protein involved in chromosome partitioning